MTILRFASRPTRAAVPAPKTRKLRVVPKAKQGHWANVPGFIDWLRAHGPTMTNRDLVVAIQEHFKITVTLMAVGNLRQRYNVPMTPETRRKAYSKRESGTAATTPDDGMTATQRMDAAAMQAHIRKLTQKQTFYELVGEKIIEAVRELPKFPPVRVPTIVIPKKLSEEEAVLVISDVQAGLTTSARETGGLGEFNTQILMEEIQYLEDSIIAMQRYHSNVKKLNVVFNGDIVEGTDIFSGQLREIDMHLVEQIMFCKERFARFLFNLAHHFEQVWCTGTVGNHGRLAKKGEHSPMENFDYLVYRWLEERTASVKNITWEIPETWWKIFEVQGWRLLAVHGDDTGSNSLGIPFYGAIRHRSRYREMLKMTQARVAGPPDDFDYMILGHHSEVAQFQNVIMAGSWPGGTEFSIKRMQATAIPTAPYFGVHRAHGVTWRRDIQLRPIRTR